MATNQTTRQVHFWLTVVFAYRVYKTYVYRDGRLKKWPGFHIRFCFDAPHYSMNYVCDIRTTADLITKGVTTKTSQRKMGEREERQRNMAWIEWQPTSSLGPSARYPRQTARMAPGTKLCDNENETRAETAINQNLHVFTYITLQ